MTNQEDPKVGHNSNRIAADELRLFLERIERLDEEKKSISDDIRDIYTEAKGKGYDAKIMRKVLAIRKMDRDEYLDQQALLDTYCGALGILG